MVIDGDHIGALTFFAIGIIGLVWIVIKAIIDSKKENNK